MGNKSNNTYFCTPSTTYVWITYLTSVWHARSTRFHYFTNFLHWFNELDITKLLILQKWKHLHIFILIVLLDYEFQYIHIKHIAMNTCCSWITESVATWSEELSIPDDKKRLTITVFNDIVCSNSCRSGFKKKTAARVL